jgi:hypothetical protein
VLQDRSAHVDDHRSNPVTAQRRLRRLTIDLPFRCAPALSSLPGTFPVTPRNLRQHLAAVEPPASMLTFALSKNYKLNFV